MSGLAVGAQEICPGPFVEGGVEVRLGLEKAESSPDLLDTSSRQAAQCQNQKGLQIVVGMVGLSPGE